MAKTLQSSKSTAFSFRAYQDDTTELRTEQYLGRDYLVVPVIALVEGVLQGMNVDVPELALAEEFGKAPAGWDGRPVVMNHPVINGTPVSANSPTVLESYAFGILFNTRVEDSKLKTEAWLDTARAEELGGDFADVFTRLNAGETIEVSTGLFAGTEKVSGKFNGREYEAVWRGVVPDHLAFLSAGKIGACSVEDGCGTPRVNASDSDSGIWQEFKMAGEPVKTSECGCGGKHAVTANVAAAGTEEFELSRLMANSIPDGLIDGDVRKLLNAALKETMNPYRYVWIVGFTATKVVYETYLSGEYDTYATFQRSYSIDDSRQVILADDIEQVNLLTEIVPATQAAATPSITTTSTVAAITDNEEPIMAETTTEAAIPVALTDEAAKTAKDKKGDPNMKPSETPSVTPTVEPVKSHEVAPPAAQPRTMGQYLNDMPEEMREVFNSGLKLHNQKKTDLIAQLKASGRCKFGDDQLKGFNLEMLENLADLAAVPTYEGTASPRQNAREDDAVPAPLLVFDSSKAA